MAWTRWLSGRVFLAMQETWVWSLGSKIPWRRKWQPTPVFLPENSHGQRSLAGCSLWPGKGVRHDWAYMHTWGLNHRGFFWVTRPETGHIKAQNLASGGCGVPMIPCVGLLGPLKAVMQESGEDYLWERVLQSLKWGTVWTLQALTVGSRQAQGLIVYL